MILPKQVKVGGHIYKVIFPYVFKERSDLNGQACHNTNEIRISEKSSTGDKLADNNIKMIFWHEVIECINFRYCANRLSGKDNHEIIEGLGEGLFQILNDNFEVEIKCQ